MSRVEPWVRVTERIFDTPVLLPIDGGANIGCTIVSPVGPQLAYIAGPNEFLKNYTKDGVTIPRNAHISFINAYYLSFSAGLVIARSMNSTAQGAVRVYKVDDELKTVRTYFRNGVELIKKYSIGISNLSAGNWGFVMDDVVYYGGNLAEVLAAFKDSEGNPVDLSGLDSVCCDELIDEDLAYGPQVLDFLTSELNKQDVYTVVRTASGIDLYRDITTEDPRVNKCDLMNEDAETVEVKIPAVTCSVLAPEAAVNVFTEPEGGKLMFTLVSKNAGTKNDNDCYITISKTRVLRGRKVFDLTTQDGVGEPETYLVSMDPEASDNSEVNCFIEQLNSMKKWGFQVVAAEGVDPDTTWTALSRTAFGEGFIEQDKSATTPYLRQALDTLDDQELYDISYLAPVGLTSVSFVRTMCSMGQRRKWFCPIDVPFDRTNANSIAAYAANIPDSYNNYMVGPFDKNGGLTGWVNYIAGSTLYWERVMQNRANRLEFAPVFDKQTGLMAYTNPVKLLKKSQRERLLSLALPVNYAVFDQRSESYYMNDNWTHYSMADNIMGEENCVRMAHRISLDLEKLMQQFKAKQNSEETRRLVVNVINLYMANNIMNQGWAPEEYMVICDRSNNTDEVINARKMAVRVLVRQYKSIKYIEVYNDQFSVGGQPFTA